MEEWDGSALPRCSAHGKNESIARVGITSKAGTTSKTESGSIVCAHTNLFEVPWEEPGGSLPTNAHKRKGLSFLAGS